MGNPIAILGGTLGVGGASADVGAGVQLPPVNAYGVMDSTEPDGGGFGPGTTSRRALVIWGASLVWLVLVWRAVEGY